MGENLPANAGAASLIPGSGRFPGEGNGIPLQYSCLGNPMDRGAWRATVFSVAKSWTRLSMHSWHSIYQFSSVSQSCPTLCNPTDCSTPGLPVHHQLPECAQTHLHHVSDAIQLSQSLFVPFSSCLQSFPASGSFQMNQIFASGSQSIVVLASTSVLPMNI